MDTAPPIPTGIPAPPRRRRWWWTITKIVIGIAFSLMLALLGGWWWSHRTTEVAWQEAVLEAEADLARWRLLELEEDRPKIPDAENAALHIIAINKQAGRVAVNSAANYEEIFKNLPPTARLNHQQEELIRNALAKIEKPLIEARKLKDMSRGRFPVSYTDDYLATAINEHQEARQVAGWLQHDAMLRADEEEYDAAVESCRAIVTLARTFDGDAMFLSLLIRIAMNTSALTTLERVLAQGQASEEALRAMQAAVEKEASTSGWLACVRGERAGHHHLFDNIRTGKIPLSTMTGGFGAGPGSKSLGDRFVDVFPYVILKYYPEHLKNMNRAVEISKLPIHERGPELETLAQELGREIKTRRNIVSGLMMPAFVKVHYAEIRNQATLRAAIVALACERYRLAHPKNDWPATIDLLVKEKLLDAIPLDPVDGQPIRFRRTKDGLVIYSIGIDRTDNQGHFDRERPYEPGVDIGFRLWNVKSRRQAPLPPVVQPQ